MTSKPDRSGKSARAPVSARDKKTVKRARKSGGSAFETAELYQLLVESVREYEILALDREGFVLSWNIGAQRLSQYTADEIIGRHFSVFFMPEDIAAGIPEKCLEEAARNGSFNDESWRVRKDGSRFWASILITALCDKHGELMGFAKVARDLTDRREAEERALADARRIADAEATNRAKAEFVAMLSHELRTPLNAINGYTELLTIEIPGKLNEQQMQYLDRIRAGQQHLLTLVNDLIQIAHPEGPVSYKPRAVPIGELFSTIQSMVQPRAQDKQLAFEIKPCAADVSPYADVARTQQVLLNLLSNAVKFTPAGGRIQLACESTDDKVNLTVSDTGPGIPADKLEAIFEPFVQLERSLNSAREGMGLGLPISRDLARRMNGELTAASRPGEGSTFTLTLPRA